MNSFKSLCKELKLHKERTATISEELKTRLLSSGSMVVFKDSIGSYMDDLEDDDDEHWPDDLEEETRTAREIELAERKDRITRLLSRIGVVIKIEENSYALFSVVSGYSYVFDGSIEDLCNKLCCTLGDFDIVKFIPLKDLVSKLFDFADNSKGSSDNLHKLIRSMTPKTESKKDPSLAEKIED